MDYAKDGKFRWCGVEYIITEVKNVHYGTMVVVNRISGGHSGWWIDKDDLDIAFMMGDAERIGS